MKLANQLRRISGPARNRRAIRERQSKLERDAEQKKQGEIEAAKRRIYIAQRLQEIEEKLKEVAREGETSWKETFYTLHPEEGAAVSALEDMCKKEGLDFSSKYETGTINMGDSAAPCNVDYAETVVTISWKV